VSFDGTGYGLDGAIWGGEFLFSGYTDFKRLVHMNYVPLPGGDKAVHEPWRIALAWLHAAGVPWEPDLAPVDWGLNLTNTNTTPAVLEVVRRQIETGINAPPTSSIGRLFDAVSSLIGLRQSVNYEAQAAIELEAQAALHEFGIYQFERRVEILDFTPAIRAIVGDLRNKIPTQVIAARFHNTLALLIQETCRSLRDETGSNQVVLSGGVWQNRTLLARTYNMLKNDNFEIYTHHTVPANDGGISLGQAAVAMHRILNGQLNLSNVPNNLPT
ncbi:MAG: hypothetical protein ACK2UW_09025, partial [Anaerolineales bacterium]